MKKLEEGEVIRGFVVKLYPTQEQTKWLQRLQVELRIAWNVLVEQHEKWVWMTIERAVADGVIEPLPPRPEKDAPRPERAKWNYLKLGATIAASKHARTVEIEWPSLTLHKHNYEPLMQEVARRLGEKVEGQKGSGSGASSLPPSTFRLEAGITAYRSVMKRFAQARVPRKGVKWRVPRFKRDAAPWLEYMPIQLLDGICLHHEGGKNYTVRFWRESIRARGSRPEGDRRPIAGLQITRRADGWHAAVRSGGPGRVLEPPTKGAVGVAFGLQTLAMLSTGECIANPRGEEYAKLVAWFDEKAAELAKDGLENEAEDMRMRGKRYRLKYSRKTMNAIYTELLPMLVAHDRIYIGEMTRGEVQGEVNRLGEDDDGGSLSACGIARSLVEERYGDRVVNVPLPGIGDENMLAIAVALVHPKEAA